MTSNFQPDPGTFDDTEGHGMRGSLVPGDEVEAHRMLSDEGMKQDVEPVVDEVEAHRLWSDEGLKQDVVPVEDESSEPAEHER